jgi:tyrosyl-tRNA synthetase
MSLIEELQWRGMIQDIMPGTEEQLSKEMTSGYIGFDPTADSLHIGSLVPILLLVHMQRAGHKPIALIGGATGMVGDPSGKSEERNLLDETTLQKNLAGVKRQLQRYLDFDPSRPNAAEMVNNYDWFKNMHLLDFIRDIGKHITVNYMMAKDSVRKRLEGDAGMSFTEFTYQLVQGYDFYWLFTHKHCKLQMGGSDQWGNITTGTELIRRKSGGEAFAFTCPLVTKIDGGKFGKTEKGNIWLDPAKTSPYHFYQFWLNASDADAEKWIRTFTFLGKPEIEDLTATQALDPSGRALQKALAREVTVFVHGQQEYDHIMDTTRVLFENDPVDFIRNNTVETVENSGIPSFEYEKNLPADILSLLTDCGMFASKGELRRLIQGGGLSVNGEKVSDPNRRIGRDDLIHDRYLLVHKGKKTFSLLKKV